VNKYTVTWTGWTGSPGYSTFYCDGTATGAEPANAVGRIRTFFEAIKSFLPSAVTLTYPSVTQTVAEASGIITGETSFTPPASTVGTGSSFVFASLAGACVTWGTNTFISGHRIRGRTFVIPAASSLYQADGTIVDASLTTMRTAATAYVVTGLAASPLVPVVWHRPVGGVGGVAAPMSAASISDKVAVLKSRRG